jgi:hypothetical protein
VYRHFCAVWLHHPEIWTGPAVSGSVRLPVGSGIRVSSSEIADAWRADRERRLALDTNAYATESIDM